MRVDTQEATRLLSQGEVVALPTETVYGLAASLYSPTAIEKVFQLKGRPSANPLIIHVAAPQDLCPLTRKMPPEAERLAEQFWPGPLTLILPANTDQIPSRVRAGLDTAAFRVPGHPLTRSILEEVGPLVMPSANLSGRPSTTHPSHVEHDFGPDFPVLEGGATQVGVESTVLGFVEGEWQILRLGGLSQEEIGTVLGYLPPVYTPVETDPVRSPGSLFRHYAPSARLLLTPTPPTEPPYTLIGFSDRTYPSTHRVIAWGRSDQPQEVAHRLYSTLRQIDAEKLSAVWVDTSFPNAGLWKTLHERIRRAATDTVAGS